MLDVFVKMYLLYSYYLHLDDDVNCGKMSKISKSEYRAIIKFVTLEKQPANNIHERLVSICRDSPSYMQPSPDGSLNFNVGEHHWKMTPEMDGQLRRAWMIVAVPSKHW